MSRSKDTLDTARALCYFPPNDGACDDPGGRSSGRGALPVSRIMLLLLQRNTLFAFKGVVNLLGWQSMGELCCNHTQSIEKSASSLHHRLIAIKPDHKSAPSLG